MTKLGAVLAILLCAAFPAAAQEPVVAVADPEALFVDADPALHANKQLALHFMRELLQCNHWERAPEWLSERYLQHNPNGRFGRDGIMAFFTRKRPRTETCGKLTTPLSPCSPTVFSSPLCCIASTTIP